MPAESKFQQKEWLTAIMVGKTPTQYPRSEAEWKTLLETAAVNRVITLCHHQIADMPIKEQCPDWFLQAIKKHAFRTAASEMAQSHELEQLLEEFASQGIYPLLMKGAALAYSLYPQPYLRERCDTDMLIRVADITTVFDILDRIGYQYHRVDDLLTRQVSFSKAGPGGVANVLDIHWRISNRPLFQNTLTYTEIEPERRKIPELGDHAFTLDSVHSLVLACLHRVAEGAFGARENLLWLYDIHLLLSRMSESEYKTFAGATKQKQIQAICLDALTQSIKWLKTQVPAWVLNALSDNQVSEPSARLLVPNAPRYQLSDLYSTPGIRNKWQCLREALFPPSAYLLRYEMSDRKIFLPVFYVRRIWRSRY